MNFYEKVYKACFSWNWFSSILTLIQKETKKKFYEIFLITTYRICRGATRNLSGEISWNKGKLTKKVIWDTQTKGPSKKSFGVLSPTCSWNCILNDKFKLICIKSSNFVRNQSSFFWFSNKNRVNSLPLSLRHFFVKIMGK